MPRKRRQEEHENHERWLVSYADFITLLFAFFVVMYSVSSVNEGKYRVLSDTMVSAFSNKARSMQPIQIGEEMRAIVSEGDAAPTSLVELDLEQGVPVNSDALPEGEGEDVGIGEGEQENVGEGVEVAIGDGTEPHREVINPQDPSLPPSTTNKVADKLEQDLGTLIDDDLLEVRREGDWVEIEMKSSILFGSGSTRLVGQAIPVLRKLSEALRTFPNPIQVEGFTDNVPISTREFPSNWELSAARAASVVHLLTRYNIRPDRMLAIGYGEHRPVASNDTEEGRLKNRRIVMIIPSEKDARQHIDLERMIDQHDQQSPL